MQFAIRNLSVLAYAQGFTLWHYRAGWTDLQCIAAPGFFNGACTMLSGGDMVLVSSAAGGRILTVQKAAGQVFTTALT